MATGFQTKQSVDEFAIALGAQAVFATTRKHYRPEFKVDLPAEALHGERTQSQMALQFQVHPIQLAQQRKALLESKANLSVNGLAQDA